MLMKSIKKDPVHSNYLPCSNRFHIIIKIVNISPTLLISLHTLIPPLWFFLVYCVQSFMQNVVTIVLDIYNVNNEFMLWE